LAWAATSALAIWALPWGNHKFENLIFTVAQAKADLALKERVFLDNFPGLVIYINRLPGDGQMQDVFIVDERDPTRAYTVVAKRGRIYPSSGGKIVVRLYEGTIHGVGAQLKTAQTAQFESYDVTMEAPGFGGARRTSKHEKEMMLDELIAEMAKEAPGSKRYYLLDMELQKKFTLPFSCLVMALIGLPLGSHSRSGRSWGVAVALAVFFTYYLMLSAAWSFGVSGAYPPKVGMWVPNLFFGLLGLVMFNRERREAPIPILDNLNKIPALFSRLRARGRTRTDAD